jgi:hypothetical protein
MPAAKQWNAANFRFRIGGLDAESAAVTKVAEFALRQNTKNLYIGEDRFPSLQPTGTNYSHLMITLPSSKAGGILRWSEETIANRSITSKTARLEYLRPGDGAHYFAVDFAGVEIASRSFPKPTGSANSNDVNVELFYDSLRFSYS